MQVIAISDFKAKCLKLISLVDKTKNPIIIKKNGKPIAEIIPYKEDNDLQWLSDNITYCGDVISSVKEEWKVLK